MLNIFNDVGRNLFSLLFFMYDVLKLCSSINYLLIDEDPMLNDQHQYRYMTVDDMKSLGDDSLKIDVTRDEKTDVVNDSASKFCLDYNFFFCIYLSI